MHLFAGGIGEDVLNATYATTAGFTLVQSTDTRGRYLTMPKRRRMATGSCRQQMPTACCA